jgi:hypothetical protein
MSYDNKGSKFHGRLAKQKRRLRSMKEAKALRKAAKMLEDGDTIGLYMAAGRGADEVDADDDELARGVERHLSFAHGFDNDGFDNGKWVAKGPRPEGAPARYDLDHRILLLCLAADIAEDAASDDVPA